MMIVLIVDDGGGGGDVGSTTKRRWHTLKKLSDGGRGANDSPVYEGRIL